MLKITEVDGLTAGGRAAADLQVVDLREERRNRRQGSVLLADPQHAIPQRDRRAVGRFVAQIGHALDAAAVGVPLMMSHYVRGGMVAKGVVVLFVLIVTLLLWPTHRSGRHVIGPSEGLLSIVTRLGLAPVVTWVLLMVQRWGDGAGVSRYMDVVVIIQIVVFTLPLVLIGRLVSYRMALVARSRGYDLEDTLIVGSGPTGREIANALIDNPHVGLKPCGFVDGYDDESDLPLVGRPKDLPEILAVTGIRNVVIAFGAATEQELVRIVRRCHDRRVQFYLVPRLFELGVSAGELGHEVDGLPLVKVQRPGTYAEMWPAKRAFDVVAASLLLLLTSPVFIASAIAVKLSSPGPVFFKQMRCGIGSRPFEIFKFRTMRVNDDSNTQWTVDNDDRVTWVGRILRPSHLDELPQLLNVLRGDMSLVGPRPERPHFVEQFTAEIDGYEYRHRVPVGITGWAQVNGYWGDTSIERRVRLDNRYIENWSMWRDLVIALRTFPTLFGKRR